MPPRSWRLRIADILEAIDTHALWQAATEDLPRLVEPLRRLLEGAG